MIGDPDVRSGPVYAGWFSRGLGDGARFGREGSDGRLGLPIGGEAVGTFCVCCWDGGGVGTGGMSTMSG